MRKEFHIWLCNSENSINYPSYYEADTAVKQGEAVIHTYATAVFKTALFEHGYRLFAHFGETDSTEVVLGDGNERTSRNITPKMNLEKLLLAGEFN